MSEVRSVENEDENKKRGGIRERGRRGFDNEREFGVKKRESMREQGAQDSESERERASERESKKERERERDTRQNFVKFFCHYFKTRNSLKHRCLSGVQACKPCLFRQKLPNEC